LSNEIIDSVAEAKSPGKFNIVDVLQNRGYPETTIKVVLDESVAYKAAMIREQIEKLDDKISAKSAQVHIDKQQELMKSLDEVKLEIAKNSYSIHLMGISEGKREEFFNQARKKYPIEWENSNNIQDMLSGQSRKVEKESPERDALFTDYIWLGHIKKIVSPDGDEQTEFNYQSIRAMRESFPLSAIMKINESIEKLRTATAIFIMETNEDFLAKP
jgi:hypothetical protein